MSTKLKLLGVDVASFGDAFATTEGALELVFADAVTGVYKKLVVSEDGTRLLGGILVGDASAYGILRPMVSSGLALPDNPEQLILPVGGSAPIGMPDEAQVCSCNDVTKAVRRVAVRPGRFRARRGDGGGAAARGDRHEGGRHRREAGLPARGGVRGARCGTGQ
jgi:NAD(P)H-nitrite reductase large subunit